MDNAGTVSMRYSINDYRFRNDGLVGNVHSNSSVVVGGGSCGIVSGLTGSGGHLGGMASSSSSIISDVPHSPTPPLQRRLAKSFSVAPSNTQNRGALSFCIKKNIFVFLLHNFHFHSIIFFNFLCYTKFVNELHIHRGHRDANSFIFKLAMFSRVSYQDAMFL